MALLPAKVYVGSVMVRIVNKDPVYTATTRHLVPDYANTLYDRIVEEIAKAQKNKEEILKLTGYFDMEYIPLEGFRMVEMVVVKKNIDFEDIRRL